MLVFERGFVRQCAVLPNEKNPRFIYKGRINRNDIGKRERIAMRMFRALVRTFAISFLLAAYPFSGAADMSSVAVATEQAPSARVSVLEQGDMLSLKWQGDETIEVSLSKHRGLFQAPVGVRVNDREIAFDGFYAHINKHEDEFVLAGTESRIENDRIVVDHILRHVGLPSKAHLRFTLWFEPQDRALRVEVAMTGDGLHLDRLGIGDMVGDGLEAERMFFGRMYVLDKPKAFEHRHNYNSCRFWCWTMANGLSVLQATKGPARGFRFDPALGRYDLSTYCDPPITYYLLFTEKGPQEAIAEYRDTIDIPAPPTLNQLPGRVGVMTAYPIAERYEDFLEEWAGKGARDFVWLSYYPTPGDRQKVEPYGALYATYDLYLDIFREGPRKAEGWAPEIVQYRDNGKMVRGYWSSSWLLPEHYVDMATKRVMGVFGREYRDDDGNNAFIPTPATRYSNLAITREEVGPSALYLDVHASKVPHYFYDHLGRHHHAGEHMSGEKALFDFAREYLGNVPIWSEGGAEDYAGLMDGGWFMDLRPPEELGIHAAKWQYYPFVDQVHRERLLNMSIYYPVDHYDTEMVNLAILFGRPQAVSAYYGSRQDNVGGLLQAYYMTKGFHRMLGLSRLERVDFHEDDIDRCVVSYSNGARAWVNRSDEDWALDDYTLPPGGYLLRGPNGFVEYRARWDASIADFVHCDEYDYFACTARMDFGPVVTDGALAITHKGDDRLIVYEVQKPHGAIELRLGELPGTDAQQRAVRAWAVLTRNRRIELKFPDLRQPTDPQDRTKLGNTVQVRPVEMRNTLYYEVELTPRNTP
jgi:hypothetical protein